MFKLKSRYYALLLDSVMVGLAWLGAFALLIGFNHIPTQKGQLAFTSLLPVVILQAVCFVQSGLYRGFWRYVSVPDLMRMLKAVTAGVLLITFGLFLVTHLQGFPRSVIPVYALSVLALIAMPRIVYRRYYERRGITVRERVLIIGAGEAGQLLVRDLMRHPAYGYHVVAFVDDDTNKRGKEVYGVRVVGNCQAIEKTVRTLQISKILIAIPTATAHQMRRIVGFCQASGVSYRTLPSLTHIATGQVNVEALHEVSLDDLLGREPVKLDWQQLHEGIQNQCIMVTGGGGSIGFEICMQLAKLKPEKIIVIEQCEYNLYRLQRAWAKLNTSTPLLGFLQDCADVPALTKVMQQHKPQVIFHAAAYKHVPLLETQKDAAIKNNILATHALADAACRFDVEKFIFISTDKAVSPQCVMGKTKRFCELLCASYNAQALNTRFITVRFGNVLGSRGSVVPLFKAQIASGGPVTVTDPNMQRYFMTLSEACCLILQSALLGRGGEIFVLDMGEPISIVFLAEQMITLAGLKPHQDIDIVYTGMREGEKLNEMLCYADEPLTPTSIQKILMTHHPTQSGSALFDTVDAIQQALAEGKGSECLQWVDSVVDTAQATSSRTQSTQVFTQTLSNTLDSVT